MESKIVKITILIDNQAVNGLDSEHGLAMWIAHENGHILFDTGQKNTFAKNAERLGIDIAQTDDLVLSHGHFDHTGGIPHVLNMAPKVNVHCHPAAVYPRYAVRDGAARAIQMPQASMMGLDRMTTEHLHWVRNPVQLSERVGITGYIPRQTSYEDTGGPFYLDPLGNRKDDIEDDMALWIRTDKGLVVCVGCSHAGLVNTLNYIRELNNREKIHAVIGGFHLMTADFNRMEKTLNALSSINPDIMVPCHCTGKPAVSFLQDAMGSRVIEGAAGDTYEF